MICRKTSAITDRLTICSRINITMAAMASQSSNVFRVLDLSLGSSVSPSRSPGGFQSGCSFLCLISSDRFGTVLAEIGRNMLLLYYIITRTVCSQLANDPLIIARNWYRRKTQNILKLFSSQNRVVRRSCAKETSIHSFGGNLKSVNSIMIG